MSSRPSLWSIYMAMLPKGRISYSPRERVPEILVYMRSFFSFLISRALERGTRFGRILREELRGQLAVDFVYKPLPNPRAFRLLSVEPGGWTAPLKCSLQEVSLDDNSIAFTATSYTWAQDRSWKLTAVSMISSGVFLVRILMGALIRARLGSWAAEAFMAVTLPYGILSSFTARVASSILQERRHTLLCNGKRMVIRANLYEFLLQLRQSGKEDAKYWIDAICVDQSNILERNDQVQLMTTIYQRAEQVFAWLGTCPSLLDHPKLMGCVHADFKLSDLKFSDARDYSNLLRIALRPFARFHILCCGYFKRTWIIQELLLPHNVIFFVGQYQLSPNEVSDVVRMTDFWMARVFLGSSYDSISYLLESRKQYRAKGIYTLSEYLTTVVRHQASDIRDLIFAGSGLISPSRGDSTVLDITTRLDVVSSGRQESLVYRPDYAARQLDVYISCVHQLLRDEGLYALSFACSNLTASSNPQQPFPSWFPQLNLHHALRPLRAEVGDTFSAGGTAKAAITLIPEGCIRLDSGADEVDTVEKVLKYTIDINFIMDILGQLPTTYTTTGELTITAVSRMLVTDSADGRRIPATECIEGLTDFLRAQLINPWLPDLDHSQLHNIVETSERAAYPDRTPTPPDGLTFLRANTTIDDEEFDSDTPVLDFVRSSKGTHHPENAAVANCITLISAPKASVYERALKQRCANRSFFITTKGYIGLGSSELQTGDVIMVFPGAYVPFALRLSTATTKGEEVRYRLIGEAYVHGIMYGERLSSPEWKPGPIMIH